MNAPRQQPVLLQVAGDRPEPESLCWRSWPCKRCRAGATAIGFLSGRHSASGPFPSVGPNELIDHITALERSWLLEWIASCNHSPCFAEKLPLLSEGSEHFVYLHEPSGNVIKVTKPGIYGDLYYLEDGLMAQCSTTPGEYIVRMRMVSKQFGLEWTPIGMTDRGQIVSRQRFISGEPPTQDEVDEFLFAANLTPVRQKYWLWKGEEKDGFEPWVGDARADNFVRTANGLVPIDIRMWNVMPETEDDSN